MRPTGGRVGADFRWLDEKIGGPPYLNEHGYFGNAAKGILKMEKVNDMSWSSQQIQHCAGVDGYALGLPHAQ